MQRKLLFFVNPRAGHSEIRGSLMQAIQIFTAGGYEVTVHPTSAARPDAADCRTRRRI